MLAALFPMWYVVGGGWWALLGTPTVSFVSIFHGNMFTTFAAWLALSWAHYLCSSTLGMLVSMCAIVALWCVYGNLGTPTGAKDKTGSGQSSWGSVPASTWRTLVL